jgi:RNA polymerase sigma-70 factor (sigma-E family)
VTYDEFVAARLQPLLRYATMLTGDPHLAADLVQEVMVRVQLKWRRVAAVEVPDLYVRRILTNAYLDLRRTSWWRRNTLWARPEDAAPVPVASDHAQRSADRDEVWTLLLTLPERQRAALVLRFYEDLSDAEIAGVLDCAVGTVRSQISRALASLRATVPAAGLSETMEARP